MFEAKEIVEETMNLDITKNIRNRFNGNIEELSNRENKDIEIGLDIK